MAIATMTSKGQLTVPKAIRDRLDLKPGDKVDLMPSGELGVLMRKRRIVRLQELMGFLPTNGISKTLEALEQDLGDAIVEHVTQR